MSETESSSEYDECQAVTCSWRRRYLKSRSEGRSHPHWHGQASWGGAAVRGARGRGGGGRWFDGSRLSREQSVRERARTLQGGHTAQVILATDWPAHNIDIMMMILI